MKENNGFLRFYIPGDFRVEVRKYMDFGLAVKVVRADRPLLSPKMAEFDVSRLYGENYIPSISEAWRDLLVRTDRFYEVPDDYRLIFGAFRTEERFLIEIWAESCRLRDEVELQLGKFADEIYKKFDLKWEHFNPLSGREKRRRSKSMIAKEIMVKGAL